MTLASRANSRAPTTAISGEVKRPGKYPPAFSARSGWRSPLPTPATPRNHSGISQAQPARQPPRGEPPDPQPCQVEGDEKGERQARQAEGGRQAFVETGHQLLDEMTGLGGDGDRRDPHRRPHRSRVRGDREIVSHSATTAMTESARTLGSTSVIGA